MFLLVSLLYYYFCFILFYSILFYFYFILKSLEINFMLIHVKMTFGFYLIYKSLFQFNIQMLISKLLLHNIFYFILINSINFINFINFISLIIKKN